MGSTGSNRRPTSGAGREAKAKRNVAPRSKAISRTSSNEFSVAEHGGDAVIARFDVTIPSTDPAARDVLERIVNDAQRMGYNNQSTFAIRLATQEALINASRHGNKRDPAKKIHIASRINAREAIIEVEDEGAGFKRKDVPDPTHEDNLEKATGRGIHLIEAYMNRVSWTRGGRKVRMVRYNGPDVFPRA